MTTKEYQKIVFDAAINTGLNETQAKLITAQATHETGNFKSNVFKTDNNLFGMKMPSRRNKQYIERPSTIIMRSEGATPYAHYSSIENSVNDLVLGWHKYNGTNWSKIKTPADYATYLKSKGYYGDTFSNYLSALVRYFNSLDWLKITGSFVAVILIAAIFLLIQNK